MTEQSTPDVTAEVTAFVEALDATVLQDLCNELQPVQPDLTPRDQLVLKLALERLAKLPEGNNTPSAPSKSSLRAFQRP